MITIGPYTQGEIPSPLTFQFLDSAGAAINLSGYTVKFLYRVGSATAVTRDGALVSSGTTGIVSYTWVAADLATAGNVTGEFVVGNATNRYGSERLSWVILEPVTTYPSV
jgi:hypothetical protein